jgi:hypothetical protein
MVSMDCPFDAQINTERLLLIQGILTNIFLIPLILLNIFIPPTQLTIQTIEYNLCLIYLMPPFFALTNVITFLLKYCTFSL